MKGRKNIIVLTLVALLFINYVGTNIMYGLYMVDQSLFVELFCENKDHPEEHCDGSCMISKLSDHDHQSEAPSVMDVYQVQLVFYIQDNLPEITIVEEEFHSSFYYGNLYYFQFFEDIIQPPPHLIS